MLPLLLVLLLTQLSHSIDVAVMDSVLIRLSAIETQNNRLESQNIRLQQDNDQLKEQNKELVFRLDAFSASLGSTAAPYDPTDDLDMVCKMIPTASACSVRAQCASGALCGPYCDDFSILADA
jgi:hypothetical protein